MNIVCTFYSTCLHCGKKKTYLLIIGQNWETVFVYYLLLLIKGLIKYYVITVLGFCDPPSQLYSIVIIWKDPPPSIFLIYFVWVFFYHFTGQSYSLWGFDENTVRTILWVTWSTEITMVLPIGASLKPHILQANTLHKFYQCNSSPSPPPSINCNQL